MKNLIKISLTTLSIIIVLSTCSFAVTGTINAKRGLVLRQEQDKNSNPITLVPDSTEVEIIEKNGEWYKAKYNSQEGYLFAEYVDVSEEVSENNETTENENNNVSKNVIKVYNIPLITSTVVNELPENTEVVIEKQITNWSYIRAGEIEGWARTYVVTGGEMQVPVEEIQNPEIQEPKQNNEEEIQEPITEQTIETPTNEAPTNSNEETQEKTAKKGVVNVDSANIRKEPTTESDIVTNLIRGTEFDIKAEENDWYKMEYKAIDGTIYEGYIFKDLATV